jgi:outer membrane protein
MQNNFARWSGWSVMLCAAVLPVAGQSAPGAPGLSLSGAVQYTLDRNPLLAIQQREVDINNGLKQQAASQFDTNVQWSAGQTRSNSPLTVYEQRSAALNGIHTANRASNTTDYTVGAQKLLRSGILINPGAQLNRNTDNLTFQDGANLAHAWLQVVLPLARNRGRDAVAAQESSAQLAVDASLYDLSEAAAGLIANTVAAYWNYVAATRALQVFRGSEDRGRTLVGNVQALIAADRLARGEIHDVTANLADRVTSRISAEQQVIQARQTLGIAMGLGAEEIVQLPAPTDDFPNGLGDRPPSVSSSSIRHYAELALTRRAGYLASRKRQDAAGVLAHAARNQLRPQIDLAVSAGYSGLKEGRRPDRLLVAPFTQAGGPDATATLRYTFPVQNSYSQGQLLQAASTYSQAGLKAFDLSRTIASDVTVAATSVGNAIDQWKNAHQAVVAYQAALDGEHDKLRLGVGSLIDLLTVEDRLTAALTSEVRAQLAYATWVIRFRFSTGTLIAPDRVAQNVDPRVLVSSPFQDGETAK